MPGGGSEGPAAHTLQKLTQLTPAPEYLAIPYEIKFDLVKQYTEYSHSVFPANLKHDKLRGVTDYIQQQQHKLYLHDYNYLVTVLQKL